MVNKAGRAYPEQGIGSQHVKLFFQQPVEIQASQANDQDIIYPVRIRVQVNQLAKQEYVYQAIGKTGCQEKYQPFVISLLRMYFQKDKTPNRYINNRVEVIVDIPVQVPAAGKGYHNCFVNDRKQQYGYYPL